MTALLYDRSALGKLVLTGPDAPGFLHNISTNDIKPMPLGAGCETFFCDARAKALYFAVVYHVRFAGKNALWLETVPGAVEGLQKHLDKFLIAEQVEIHDVTADYAQFHLAGPEAPAILERALADTLLALPEFYHMERTFGATATANIRRHEPLGLSGYDIVCRTKFADGIHAMLVDAGAAVGTPEQYETHRIEAGTPTPGIDFDAARFVMEIGRAARAVYYQKGCFPGQEPIVMARDRTGRINRSFLRLSVEGDEALPVGTKLTAGETDAGVITSSALSPRLGSIAVGYVGWKFVEAGTMLTTPNGLKVTVVGPPTEAHVS